MYLDARARGRGVGARLLDAAERWCRAQGGQQLVLDTTHQMTAAIAFYESHGSGFRGLARIPSQRFLCSVLVSPHPRPRPHKCWQGVRIHLRPVLRTLGQT
jgi:predicted N-acetyltransferase YhbS